MCGCVCLRVRADSTARGSWEDAQPAAQQLAPAQLASAQQRPAALLQQAARGSVRSSVLSLAPPAAANEPACRCCPRCALCTRATALRSPPDWPQPFAHTPDCIRPAYKRTQFERTLIVCEEGAFVSYLEGCTAPAYDTNQLHAAVVELYCDKDAEIKYSTVQNW